MSMAAVQEIDVPPPPWVRLGADVVAVVLPQRLSGFRDILLQGEQGDSFQPVSHLPMPQGDLLLARSPASGLLNLRIGDGAWLDLGAASDHGVLAKAAAMPRFLALLASKVAGPLRAAADPLVARDLLALARDHAVPAPDALRPLIDLDRVRGLWRLPTGGWLLTPRGLTRVADPEAGLSLLPALPNGALLLRAEGPPLRLPPPPPGVPGLVELARQDTPDRRALLRQAMLALRRHTEEPWCREALRDAQLLFMAPARAAGDPANAVAGALDRAISDHAGGVFLIGWLHDPLRLIRGMTLRGPFGGTALPADHLFPATRADVVKRFEQAPFGAPDPRPGFVAHLPDAGPGPVAQWRLELALGSGEAVELIAGPALVPAAQAREAVLRGVNPLDVSPDLLDRCLTPAAERLHRAASAEALDIEVMRIGPPVAEPVTSLVIPLYRNLRFVRHQLAAFARDPMLRQSELIYVLDSPEQRGEAEHMLRGLCGLTGLSVTLVIHGRNAGYATACNSGAAQATAPILLMLNSDVVPDRPGWLVPLLARLAADPKLGCVGPKLMFDDGSLQHAGLYFARGPGDDWYNCHYFKGFPRHYPMACQARLVPGVTGAAMLMRREAWDSVGGFSSDYIVGDYEDSDLCLRLRQAGYGILYEPAAELFHFERQSIAQHGGYAGTVAAAYNRRLHHRRWDSTIGALMEEFPRMGETLAAA
jgi:GT2 family glycosyltransferase